MANVLRKPHNIIFPSDYKKASYSFTYINSEKILKIIKKVTVFNMASWDNVAVVAVYGSAVMPSRIKVEIIVEEGKQARERGLELDHNPYGIGTVERRNWYEGWCAQNLMEFISEQTQMISRQISFGAI